MIIDQLERIETAYEKIINKNHSSEAIIAFVDVYQQLKDEMSLMKSFNDLLRMII